MAKRRAGAGRRDPKRGDEAAAHGVPAPTKAQRVALKAGALMREHLTLLAEREWQRACIEVANREQAAANAAGGWLLLVDAAQATGVSVWKLRKWIHRKRDPVPVQLCDGEPVKPYRVRVADVEARAAREPRS